MYDDINPFGYENFSDSISVNLDSYSAGRRYKHKLDKLYIESEKIKTLAYESDVNIHCLVNLRTMSNSNQSTTLNDESMLKSIYKL